MNAQNADTNFNFISCFAGGGGSSLGYKMAGFNELLAIEFDKNAIETLKLNFPKLKIYEKDICGLTSKECLRLAGIEKGQLDILDGSPPCQGFSITGNRIVSDNRNDLFKEFVRLIKGIQPKIFVMENVSGMVKGKMKGKFLEIMQELKGLNYHVKCKQMNAMWYEVPQSRERLIFIGVRKDLETMPTYPEKAIKMPIASKQAIQDLKIKTCIWLKEEWHTNKLYDKIKIGKSLAQSLKINSGYSFIKINPNKPSNTIPKSLQIGNKRWGAHMHWTERRTLSIEEIKRLQSFPDDYKLTGAIQDKWARIGNSVPPKMMYHIARHLKKNVLEK